jgi:LuxR family transcriptional regulator, maltose regulon positive regulatory protein
MALLAVPSSLVGKVRPPAALPLETPRPRLLDRLDTDCPVTLVCGPAGSGKTVLVSSWAARAAGEGAIVAWLSLDRFDDDPGALLSGIVTTLRGTGRFDPEARLHEFESPPWDAAAAFARAVLDEVAFLDEPVWLILDEVHVLQSAAALETLHLFVRRLPPGLRLVLASRTDPQIGLPRLRVEGRLLELRAPDLAFTIDEAAELLDGLPVQLAPPAIELLHARTEGWAAGLRIAALALAASDDPLGLVERFGGDDQAVADYFLWEVLRGLPPDLHPFLLRTSICDELSVGLARELSGRGEAASVLAALERDNIFTTRVGRGLDTYRYHEMFRTYLAAELHRVDPALGRSLHLTAAEWFAARREPLRAMEHFAAVGELDRLVALSIEHGVGALLDGRAHSLAGILATLDAQGRERPALRLLGAAAALALDDLDTADAWLRGLDQPAVLEEGDEPLAALAATVALTRARYTPRVSDALTCLERTPAGATGMAALDLFALHQRGVARLYMGRYDDAVADLERAVALAQQTEHHAVRLSCLSFLAGTWGSRSHLPKMRAYAVEALQLAERWGWGSSQAVAHAHMLVGWSAYLRSDPGEAVVHAERAVTALGAHSDPDVELAVSSLHLVVFADVQPPFEALRAYRLSFARLADAQMSPALLAYAAPLLVRLCLRIGETYWAKEFVARANEVAPEPGEPALLDAMLLHHTGKIDAARRMLKPVVGGEARCHVVTTEVGARLLAAELEDRRGNTTRAHEHLLDALSIAEPIELLRPFTDDQPTRDLLVAGVGRYGHHEHFVQRILACPAPSEHAAGTTPLTPGELAVLRELPSLLSVQDIAHARSLSVNTIKTHVRAIYRKLGVSSRRQAVECARKQGLL